MGETRRQYHATIIVVGLALALAAAPVMAQSSSTTSTTTTSTTTSTTASMNSTTTTTTTTRPAVGFTLDADYQSVISNHGAAGLRSAVVDALNDAGISNADSLLYSFQEGSIEVAVFGPQSTLDDIATAVRNGNVMVELNGETFTAHSADETPFEDDDDDDDDDLDGGEIAGVVIGALILALLIGLIAYLIDRNMNHDDDPTHPRNLDPAQRDTSDPRRDLEAAEAGGVPGTTIGSAPAPATAAGGGVAGAAAGGVPAGRDYTDKPWPKDSQTEGNLPSSKGGTQAETQPWPLDPALDPARNPSSNPGVPTRAPPAVPGEAAGGEVPSRAPPQAPSSGAAQGRAHDVGAQHNDRHSVSRV